MTFVALPSTCKGLPSSASMTASNSSICCRGSKAELGVERNCLAAFGHLTWNELAVHDGTREVSETVVRLSATSLACLVSV